MKSLREYQLERKPGTGVRVRVLNIGDAAGASTVYNCSDGSGFQDVDELGALDDRHRPDLAVRLEGDAEVRLFLGAHPDVANGLHSLL